MYDLKTQGQCDEYAEFLAELFMKTLDTKNMSAKEFAQKYFENREKIKEYLYEIANLL